MRLLTPADFCCARRDSFSRSSSRKVGDTVTYSYTITNPSKNCTLTGLTLVDDHLGSIDLPQRSLNPGERLTVSKGYTVKESDQRNCSIVNQTARGHPTLKGWGMLRAARFG
ncbi:MAG: DUF7507 domain-containing protein [Methanothrix sp.]